MIERQSTETSADICYCYADCLQLYSHSVYRNLIKQCKEIICKVANIIKLLALIVLHRMQTAGEMNI